MLTADHCLRLFALHDFSVVTGYYYVAPGQLAMGPEDVRTPVAIVDERLDPVMASPRADFGWLRLAHPVAPPRRPRRGPPRVPGILAETVYLTA